MTKEECLEIFNKDLKYLINSECFNEHRIEALEFAIKFLNEH